MLNSNSNNLRVIFPEQASLIIRELAEKYNIKESFPEMLKKFGYGELPNVAKIADLVQNAAQDNLSSKKIISALQKELNLSLEDAKSLAGDLEKKILILAEKTPAQENVNNEAQEEKIEPPTKPLFIKDIYKEEIQ